MAVNIEDLKSLCDFKDGHYESKKGQDYLDALARIFPLDNINDNPFTINDIKQQPELRDFGFQGLIDYKYICKLSVRPMVITTDNRRINEKIFPIEFASPEAERTFNQSLGVSYLLTCVIDGKEYVIKNKMPIFPYFIGILYFLGTTLGYKNC